MSTAIFPTAGQMRGWLGPVVADAAEHLGSKADLYQLTPVRGKDNSSTLNPALALNDVAIKLTEISATEVIETFGENPTIIMRGKMSRVTTVRADDVLEVVSRDFIGRWLKVVKVVENPLSDSYVLGLEDTEALT